jgi:hypothetical protein
MIFGEKCIIYESFIELKQQVMNAGWRQKLEKPLRRKQTKVMETINKNIKKLIGEKKSVYVNPKKQT